MALQIPLLTPIVSGIVSIFTSVFKTKEEKLKATASTLTTTVEALKQLDATDGQIAAGASATAVAMLQNETFLSKIIRSLLMLVIAILISAWCFGYMPSNINNPMPPFISECFDLLKMGLGFYYPSRSVEKIARMFITPKLVQTIMERLTK